MNEGPALPDGWVTTRIEDVAQPSGSWTPKAHAADEFWYVDIEALDNARQVITSPKRLKVSEAPSRARVAIRAGDVLFSLVRPYLKNIAVVPDSLDGQVASTAYCAIRPSAAVDSKYLYYAFVRDTFIESVVTYGNSPPSGHDDEFLLMQVLLPPLAEQRRIVAAIEEYFTRLDAGVAALKRAQAALKRYRAAVLKAAVEGKLTASWRTQHPDVQPAGELLADIFAERRARWEADLRAKGKDPAKAKYDEPQSPQTERLPELPQGWVWATLDQLSTFLRNGLSQKPESSPPGHRILRINAVRPMSVDMDEVRYLDLTSQEVAGYFVRNGDLLFTRYNGSLDLLGVAGMVRRCDVATLHPDKLIRVQVVERHVLPSYVELASNTGHSRTHIESRARTTAGQTGISGSDIKQMPIPLPPQSEQERIVAEVEQRLSVVGALEATIAANLKRAERLRQAILERAFTGRLVPQDPDDEPASTLLERIRQGKGGAAGAILVQGTLPIATSL